MDEKPRLTVGAIIFNKFGEILLLKSPKWHNKYIFPCGHVELGETLKDALKREVKEETGLNVNNIEFIKILEFINSEEYHQKNLHFVGIQFLCKTEETEVKLNQESNEFIWINPKEAIKKDLESGTQETLKYFLKMKTPKIIMFDLGGVLLPERGDQIKKEISEFIKITKEDFSFFSEHFYQRITRGEITLLEVYQLLVQSKSLNISAKQILEKHLELYQKYCSKRDPEILLLIEELRENHQVVSLTNTESEIAEYHKKNGLFDYFEKSFISTDMHLMKPGKKIYSKVIEDLGCTPNDIIFIDDKIINIESAKEMGINTIPFKNINQLKEELGNLSINLKKI